MTTLCISRLCTFQEYEGDVAQLTSINIGRSTGSCSICVTSPPDMFGMCALTFNCFELAFISKKRKTVSSVCLQKLWKMHDKFVFGHQVSDHINRFITDRKF